MPNRSKGARLYLRERKGREPAWVILDTGQPERSTGTSDRREAETILAAYISEKTRRASGPASPEILTVAEALTIYGEEHAPHVAAPDRIGFALDPLLRFWGELPVSGVTGATCRRYVSQRPVAVSTARRELGTLSAALRYCEAEGYLTRAPRVTLPAKPPSKDRWLTEGEAARLLRAAKPHIARFILLGIYTGTRRDAILSLAWEPHPGGGWIDLEAGVLYRRGSGEAETKKRRPPAKLPRKLIAHCRRWREDGCRWAIHVKGQRVGSIKRAWATTKRAAQLPDVTPHTLRHTAITWAMQRGVPLADASGYFGVSIAELERTYLHHHPDFMRGTAAAMDRRKI